MSETFIDAFIDRHRLPETYRQLIEQELPKLVDWLGRQKHPGRTLLLGISGAQGTGKTTLADLLRLSMTKTLGWRVALLSLDDFYLAKAEREVLAQTVHPLLATRGVPGTHDVALLADALTELRRPGDAQRLHLPVFDKASDDRGPRDEWRTIVTPVDLVILEGWCVGCQPQEDRALAEPINSLESGRDRNGDWRRYVNRRLREHYAPLFAMLDRLVYLQAPDFDAVARWRWLQEQRLAQASDGEAIMDRRQLSTFLQYFERLTRTAMGTLPDRADVVIALNRDHQVISSFYRDN